MFGKGALLLVMGFSAIFLGIGNNVFRYSSRSAENFTDYYNETMAYNIAVSGANLAANEVYSDKHWMAGFDNVSFNGGTIDVEVDTSGDIKTITSTASFNGLSHTVRVVLKPSYFSKFGNYYSSISAAPATGDTFNGPFHVNGRLTTYGTPVFWGKVTSKSGLSTNWGQTPYFYGGYETGIDIPLEFDTSGMRSAATTVFKDTTNHNRSIDMELFFDYDSVAYRYTQRGTGVWTPEVKVHIDSLADEGLIYVEKGNIYTKGVVDGNLTIVATSKGDSYSGKVFFVDDFTYADDPRTNPDSDDIVGVVAERDIRLQYNSDTRYNNFDTQASMFSLNGNIGPDDNLINQNYLGQWNILGGLIAKNTRQTAEYRSVGGVYVPYKGLKFVHTYDSRFLYFVPPNFPHTKYYEVLSWYE